MSFALKNEAMKRQPREDTEAENSAHRKHIQMLQTVAYGELALGRAIS